MAFIDYYKILGVDRNIPQDQVREAYRKRAKQFHPDLHPNDPKAKAKFQALNEAYDVISDPDKRSKYDQYGEKWREADAYAKAGGGAVEVTVSGKKEVLKVQLSQEVVDPDDIEMLQDLIMAATNEALRMADEANNELMGKMTGGLGGGFPF